LITAFPSVSFVRSTTALSASLSTIEMPSSSGGNEGSGSPLSFSSVQYLPH
jgi:hypothetical protein